MNIILFDNENRDNLLPLVYTRPVANLMIGIDTIDEKWKDMLGGNISYITQDYLADKFPVHITQDNYLINGSVIPSKKLCTLIRELEKNEALIHKDDLIAARMGADQFDKLLNEQDIDMLSGMDISDTEISSIRHLWQLSSLNGQVIKDDFKRITKGKNSETIPAGTHLIGDAKDVFIAEDATVLASCLNTTDGPIYIGPGTQVMEGSLIRGPFALQENGVVKMGAKIYGGTSVGYGGKAGGEIKASIIGNYSSKGHDGYMGDSILGEWCNLGADTNTSNLKNNYDEVKLWNYVEQRFVKTSRQFIGTIMGDHSKCGINTMLNTGSVIGVSCNIYGGDYQPNFIASYSWGGKGRFKTYQVNKAFETASAVMERRNIALDDMDREILLHIFNISEPLRKLTKAV